MFTHNKPRDSVACVRALITKTHVYICYFYADFLLCFFECTTEPLIHKK